MRTLILALLSLSMLAVAPARAQDPGQIFGFILGEVERQANREHQRKWMRDQRRHHEALQQSFLAFWRACFDQNDISACDQALAFPNIGADNWQRLQAQRGTLLAADQAAREEARAEARRKIAESEARIRDLEAARARLAEAQREIEAQRLADTRALAQNLDTCRRFDLAACDRAAASPLATADDQSRIAAWRQTAEQFATDLAACRTGSVAACDQAALSPVADAAQRRTIAEWRRAASPWYRLQATVAHTSEQALAHVASVAAELRALPRSTLITGSVAGILAAVLAILMWQRRAPAAPQSAAVPAAPSGAATRGRWHQAMAWLRSQRLLARVRRLAVRLHVRALARWRTKKPITSVVAVVRPTVTSDQPRDPETAVAALQLARAYLAEFDGKFADIVDDPIAGKAGLNTLSLVSQQLVIAERADPSATLEVTLDDGAAISFTLAELKAQALYVEAVCRTSEKPRRAIAILEQAAALDPSHTGIPYLAGLLHMDLMHKSAAVAAFERALALDPDNLEFRKMLVRAQSLSGAEVAYHKVATGVRRGVATARVISLVVQLLPLIFLGTSVLTFVFASTPEGKASAFTPFLIGILLAFIFGVVRQARQRLSFWVREHSF